ncbi:MAG TPA: MG2 domain-containing protein, partial [Planctomycetota bacterium]
MNHDKTFFSPAERDQLEQELLELHFGCHENPERIEARLAAEPALRALQAEVLRQAKLLERAAKPEQPPLSLPSTAARSWRSLRHPMGRLLAAASLAACAVLGFFIATKTTQGKLACFDSEHLHLTVSAPMAVPAGSPWSFTVQAQDLAGTPAACRVRWRTFGENDAVLAADEVAVPNGAATVVVAADVQMRAPRRVEVIASHATDEVLQLLNLATAQAGPLVHVTSDRPVYRPGEPVFVRAVVLDRVTLLPLPRQVSMQAQLFDSKGAPVASDQEPAGPAGVGSFLLKLPADSAGGPHRIAVSSNDGSFATESAEIVVRSFQAPQLKKTVVLDRATYAPGARGSATVTAERMGGGAAVGAIAKATLVIDGTEVWTEQRALGANGEGTFRFVVPAAVDKGAARFVATITDGGVVEAEVKPFVVPTGKVLVAGFPEGGELIAGVANGLYLECTDPLGRPVDAAGALHDERGTQVAKFRTEHQGRVKLTFVPREGSKYHVRLAGQEETHELPAVQKKGIAMRLPGTDVAANAPLRLDLAGRGDGPWLLGVFCRGVLVGQTTLRADEKGELRVQAEVPLAASAAGVLRATVFDRNLQPVSERLVRRAAAHRVDIELLSKHEALAPGESQQVTVRTKDETGQSLGAVVGLSVTDLAAVSLGSEPRVGLADQAMLFADVERIENLGDFFPSNADAAHNVDLLLGTRGWRRFVWRNDDAAKLALAKRGVDAEAFMAREGFAQTPQVASNLNAAKAAGVALQNAAEEARQSLSEALRLALLALAVFALVELLVSAVRFLMRRLPGPWIAVTATFVACSLVVWFVRAETHGAGAPVTSFWALNRSLNVDFAKARGVDVFLKNDVHLRDGIEAKAHWARKDDDRLEALVVYAGIPAIAPGAPVFDVRGFGQQVAPVPVGRVVEDHKAANLAFDDFDAVNLVLGNYRHSVGQWRERQYAHKQTPHEGRTDFTSTIFWNTIVATGANGEASVSFATSDAVTTWLVQADAHAPTGPTGRVGQAEAKFTARLPFHLEAKLPDEVSQGDLLRLPIAAIVEGQDLREVALQVSAANGVQLGTVPASITLQNGRGRVLLPITVDTGTAAKLTLQGKAGRFEDLVAHTLRIAPRGFPHHRSAGGSVEAGKPQTFVVVVPTDAVPGSGHVTLKVYPSPLTALTEGLAGILREPHGCFEQASSSNYPNTLVLTLLDASGDDIPAIAARARELLPRGYAKITGYECKQRGYEWFGGDPGHEALTAYGLLQFHDMAKVYAVDAGMV